MSHDIVNGGQVELLIKAVTVQHLSDGQLADRYGVSKPLVHKLHHRSR